MPADPACELFLEFSRRKLFEQYWPRLRKAVEPLSDEQIWWRPNEASNSIGNLILHLNGNVWQWLVASFNRLEDRRDRPAEFNATGDLSAGDLLERLGQTLDEAAKVLTRMTRKNCSRPGTSKDTQSVGWRRFTRWLSTLVCTTGRSSTSPRCRKAATWAFIRNSVKPAAPVGDPFEPNWRICRARPEISYCRCWIVVPGGIFTVNSSVGSF